MPTESVTDTVAFFGPAEVGLNCTVTAQVAFNVPGTKVVIPSICPLPAGPHVDIALTIEKLLALAPASIPCCTFVIFVVPVLVRKNVCIPLVEPTLTVPKLRVVGTKPRMPVPVRVTCPPLTVTFAVMSTDEFTVLRVVGWNTTLIVHVRFAAKVVPQVPRFPAGRKNLDELNATPMLVNATA